MFSTAGVTDELHAMWSTLHVTASIGGCIGEIGEAPDSLIGRADQHLYQAEDQGRNCVFPGER